MNVLRILFGVGLFVTPALLHGQVSDPGFETPVVVTIPVLGGLSEYNDTVSPDYLVGSTGWYVSAGLVNQPSVTLVNNSILSLLTTPIATTAANQNQYLVLNGLTLAGVNLTPNVQGGISESVGTVATQDYLVTYQAGALGASGTADLSAMVDGVTVKNSFGGGADVALNAGTFQNESFTFTASGTNSILDFSEPTALAGSIKGVAIDNITITAVPEPGDSVVILLMGGMGLMVLRQIKQRWTALPTKR